MAYQIKYSRVQDPVKQLPKEHTCIAYVGAGSWVEKICKNMGARSGGVSGNYVAYRMNL